MPMRNHSSGSTERFLRKDLHELSGHKERIMPSLLVALLGSTFLRILGLGCSCAFFGQRNR